MDVLGQILSGVIFRVLAGREPTNIKIQKKTAFFISAILESIVKYLQSVTPG
jgi:hypothetical protein